jgi:hypothetical protein
VRQQLRSATDWDRRAESAVVHGIVVNEAPPDGSETTALGHLGSGQLPHHYPKAENVCLEITRESQQHLKTATSHQAIYLPPWSVL